jgi:hypothetical protein
LSLIFFTDRDLGKRFPEVLAAAGLTVERHHDLFSPDGSDEEWLRYAGERGRVAITHNARIRYTPNELAAVVRHRVALLVVVGKAPYPQLAQHFVDTMPRIRVFLSRHDAPFIAKVYRPTPAEIAKNPRAPGSVSLWYLK